MPRFENEFARVYGSCRVRDIDGRPHYMADGWCEYAEYDAAKAIAVLERFGDGLGLSEHGDSLVCKALEDAGALIANPYAEGQP